MGNKKTGVEGVQEEFDTFIKETIRNVTDNVLKKYARSLKHQDKTICVSDPNEYAFRGKHYRRCDS